MGKLRVLMYHKVHASRRDFLTVGVDQLREQLEYVRSAYTVIRLSELIDHISNGSSLPEKAVLITFDDGYANNHELAYPVFKSLDLPFSIFLVSDFIGKKVVYDEEEQQFLSTAQILEMKELVEYGYHGFKHLDLMQIAENEWGNEISACVDQCKALQIPVLGTWAYTYGSFPKKNRDKLKQFKDLANENGISCAFRIGNRINQVPVRQIFAIERMDIRGEMSIVQFKRKLRFGKLF